MLRRLREEFPAPLCVAAVTVEEQMRGWLAYLAQAKTVERQVRGYAGLISAVTDLQDFVLIPYTPVAAAAFDELRRSHRRRGAADLKIAATARANGATLVSANARDFADLPGLKFEHFRR